MAAALIWVPVFSGCLTAPFAEESRVFHLMMDRAQGYEHWEPTVVTDPRDSLHLVAASTEYREGALDLGRIVAFASFDGGRTWSRTVPPVDVRAHNTYFDPVVLVERETGAVILTGLGIRAAEPPVPAMARTGYDLLAWRSEDGGRTFGAPTVLATGSGLYVEEFTQGSYANANFVGADKQWTAQAPDGTILLAWSHMVAATLDEPTTDRFDLVVSTSRDAGRSWSDPTVVERGGFLGFAYPFVTTTGEWLIAAVEYTASEIHVATSRDEGATWEVEVIGKTPGWPYLSIQELRTADGSGSLVLFAQCGAEGAYRVCAYERTRAGAWGGPVPLTPASPGETVVASVALADGSVAVSWFEQDGSDAHAHLGWLRRFGELESVVRIPDALGRESAGAGHYVGLAVSGETIVSIWPRFGEANGLHAYLVTRG